MLAAPLLSWKIIPRATRIQLQPLVEPQPSQT